MTNTIFCAARQQQNACTTLSGIELALLAGKKYARARSDLYKKVRAVADVANIPEIRAQSELIDKSLHNGL